MSMLHVAKWMAKRAASKHLCFDHSSNIFHHRIFQMFASFICTLDPQRSRNIMCSFQFEICCFTVFKECIKSLACVSWICHIQVFWRNEIALMCSAAGLIGAIWWAWWHYHSGDIAKEKVWCDIILESSKEECCQTIPKCQVQILLSSMVKM